MTACHARHPRVPSPTAEGTNRLLWGDWEKGDYGIIVRTPDRYDNPIMMKKMAESNPHLAVMDTPLLPASFVHASLRASNSLFFKRRLVGAAVLVGSRFSNNYRGDSNVVHAPVCYPVDAGSNKRMTMLTNNGTGCHEDGPTEGICINNKCLSTLAENCACNAREIPGYDVGDVLADWLTTKANRTGNTLSDKEKNVKFLSPYSCWYENTPLGMQETIAASNSIWRERHRWSLNDDYRYRGWTECPVTANIREQNMIDAILVSLSISPHRDHSLCDFDDTLQNHVHEVLTQMYNLGYKNHPVVFLGQSQGIINQTECDAVWGGIHCNDGYRKEIFSQPFDFSDGSCLAVPDECKDAYFFPAGKDGSKCIISSDACRQLEMNNHYHQNEDSREATTPLLSQVDESSEFLLPSFSAFASIKLVAMFAFCWVLRSRKRGRRTV